ncbi:MAG: hypothetical protein J6X61_02000, partial [Clostridia bacterium]|nr:hypothetical protein [Clostridia bacterium]
AGSAASSGSATASLPGGASSEGAASEGAPLISEAAVITASGTMTFDLAKMADAKRVLANPDKGWYLHYYDYFNGRN